MSTSPSPNILLGVEVFEKKDLLRSHITQIVPLMRTFRPVLDSRRNQTLPGPSFIANDIKIVRLWDSSPVRKDKRVSLNNLGWFPYPKDLKSTCILKQFVGARRHSADICCRVVWCKIDVWSWSRRLNCFAFVISRLQSSACQAYSQSAVAAFSAIVSNPNFP